MAVLRWLERFVWVLVGLCPILLTAPVYHKRRLENTSSERRDVGPLTSGLIPPREGLYPHLFEFLIRSRRLLVLVSIVDSH